MFRHPVALFLALNMREQSRQGCSAVARAPIRFRQGAMVCHLRASPCQLGNGRNVKVCNGAISINDHPAIRQCFAAYDMEALRIDYTVGGGANRVERGELVIYSWDRSVEPAGLV